MQWIEQRILILEQKWAAFWRDWLNLLQQVRALQQGLLAAQQQGGGGGGSSSPQAGWYCVTPASGSWGATWTSGAPTSPGSFTATVYYISGTTITNLGTQTVNNWFPASPVNSKVIQLYPDPSNAFQTGPQSCT